MSELSNRIKQAARIITDLKPVIALTGAGVSVESGIPDFRGKNGLWSKYDPARYATIDAFLADPAEVWKMLREMDDLVFNARPNPAHTGLGVLEQKGLLQYIITQNIDNLHQDGGVKNVIEYHGNSSTLSCLSCNNRYTMAEKRQEYLPTCECGQILKPDVIFFGEGIPEEALNMSFQLASKARVLLIIGTSAQVSPANTIPALASRNNAKIIEINIEKTWLTDQLTDIFLEGDAGEIITRLVEAI
ncbi:MAG: NAD-dependent deacylase [Desulfobacteraceae bacterium]